MLRPAMLCSLVLTGCVVSQLEGQESRAGTGTIRGVVFDSLKQAPLAGAIVWIDGAEGRAVADADGQFRLVNVPAGRWVLLFSHAELDSLGMPDFRHPVTVLANREARTTLAVPSLATFSRRLCDTTAQPAGMIVGTILDAATGQRVNGARVEATWLIVDRDAGPPYFRRQTVEVANDSVGNFTICGIPLDQTVSLVAAAGPTSTGTVDVAATPRHLARQDLYVSLDTTAVDSSGLLGGRAVVIGVVQDEAGRPIADADVAVEGTAVQAHPGNDGRYVLNRLPAGTQIVMTRAIGYGAVRTPVRLRDDDTLRLTSRLARLTALDTLRVIGYRNRAMDELLERLRRRDGFTLVGDHLRGAGDVISLLSALPRLRVDGNFSRGCAPHSPIAEESADTNCFTLTRRGGGSFWGAGNCRAHIWIDGLRSYEDDLVALQPRDLVAIEWYPDGAFLPARFTTRDGCAVLLIWTNAMH